MGRDASTPYRQSWSDPKHLGQPDTGAISVVGSRHNQVSRRPQMQLIWGLLWCGYGCRVSTNQFRNMLPTLVLVNLLYNWHSVIFHEGM